MAAGAQYQPGSYGVPSNAYGVAATLPVSEGVFRRHPDNARPLDLPPPSLIANPNPSLLTPLVASQSAVMWRPPWFQPRPPIAPNEANIGPAPPLATPLQAAGPLVPPRSVFWRPPWFQPKPWLVPDESDIGFVPPLDASLTPTVVSSQAAIMWRAPYLMPKPLLGLDEFDINFVPPLAGTFRTIVPS